MKQKSINEFAKLAVRDYKELEIGKIFYEGTKEVEILSDVYLSDSGSIFVDVKETFADGFTYETPLSLRDRGIINGGYNPWLLFSNKEIALEHNSINWQTGTRYCEVLREQVPIWVHKPMGQKMSTNEVQTLFKPKGN